MTTEPLDRDLAEAVWWGTATLRNRAHKARGSWRCPSRVAPYSVADPLAAQLHVRCREDGCLGIVHAIYAAASMRLQRSESDRARVLDRVRYARRVVASQVAELERAGRVSRGLPAKPTRTDGVPGRVIAAIDEQASDATERAWLEQLFRMISAYVCREHRAAAIWPTDMWASEKSGVDGQVRALGSEQVRAEILRDIQTVLGLARAVAGEGWVASNILHPFLAVVGPLPEDLSASRLLTDLDPAERALLVDFRARYAAARAAGTPPEQAFRQACVSLYGCGPSGTPEDLADAIDDLEAHYKAS